MPHSDYLLMARFLDITLFYQREASFHGIVIGTEFKLLCVRRIASEKGIGYMPKTNIFSINYGPKLVKNYALPNISSQYAV